MKTLRAHVSMIRWAAIAIALSACAAYGRRRHRRRSRTSSWFTARSPMARAGPKVITILQAKGYNVTAVQNPLTSLADDVAATHRALALQTVR